MNISILSSDVSTSKIDILDDQKIDSQSFINLATKLWRQFRYRDAELVLENAASRYPLRADIRDLSDRIKADRATLYEIRQNRLSSVHFHIDSIVNKSITKDKIRDVEIRGWVRVTKNGARLIVEQEGKTDEILEIGISRNDVVGYLKKKGVFDCVKECGFSFRADLSANLKISLLQDSDILPFVQIRSKRILQVLEGADGWLFLNNDTNRSADIFTGKMPASSNMAKSWGDFALRSKMKLDSLNIESCFVISPSKEDVFPEFYPLKPASFSILDVVRTGIFLNNVSISCPMQRLRQDVDSYYKTDTHWSDLGAWICVLDILDILKISKPKNIFPNFSNISVFGDLGSKMTPPRSSTLKKWSPIKSSALLKFDNKALGSGQIQIYENSGADVRKSVIIFGGSSSDHLARIMSDIFIRVIRINAPSTMPIMDIVEREKPDIVLLQTNARYLKNRPKICQTVRTSSLAKLDSQSFPPEWRSILPDL